MPGARVSRAAVGSWAVPASVLLVAAVSPFERSLSVPIGGFTVTTLELAVTVAIACGAFAFVRSSSRHDWHTPITAPALAVVASALVAAIAAPEFAGNALRVTGRLAAAFLLFLVIAYAASSARVTRHVIATLLASGAIVGLVAVLELAQLPAVLDLLRNFRPGFHVVGGQLRATSTLFYPTIASMYLEVAFALGLVLLVSSRAAFVALLCCGAGVVATFTRAGLITMAVSIAVFGAITYLDARRLTAVHARLAALAVVLAGLVLLSRSPQMLVARMSTDISQDWYGASYEVPDTLTLRPDSFNDIPVTLANSGRLTWQSSDEPVFALSYHWLTNGSEEVVIYDGLRTPFAQPVEPGAEVRLTARVRAPGYPGTYLLVWDVVQEHRTWLSLEGVFPGRTVVHVEGEAVTPPLATQGRMPSGTMRMPRSVLWRTALDTWRERPLVGIGPDNFRHTYGRRLGLAAWDRRVHANNNYLEVLAGMGLLGAAAVAWLAVAALGAALRNFAALDADTRPVFAAAAAAVLAIAVHGLVDSFWTFTPAYVVFAIAAGLLFGRSLCGLPSTAPR
ncbi:MAG TPA: O-antigen ligase family protein [Vicinamibacterales bacterium]|nr:O-antigen ligase family protein [Vicinamibacterales bacterium]